MTNRPFSLLDAIDVLKFSVVLNVFSKREARHLLRLYLDSNTQAKTPGSFLDELIQLLTENNSVNTDQVAQPGFLRRLSWCVGDVITFIYNNNQRISDGLITIGFITCLATRNSSNSSHHSQQNHFTHSGRHNVNTHVQLHNRLGHTYAHTHAAQAHHHVAASSHAALSGHHVAHNAHALFSASTHAVTTHAAGGLIGGVGAKSILGGGGIVAIHFTPVGIIISVASLLGMGIWYLYSGSEEEQSSPTQNKSSIQLSSG